MPEASPLIEVEQYLTIMRDTGSLASELGVSRQYITAMKFHGFRMPGGKASIRMARDFLSNCPNFQVRKSCDGIREAHNESGQLIAQVVVKARRPKRPQP